MWLVRIAALLFAINLSTAARILFIVPVPFPSHTTPINKIVEGLLARGHHISHLTSNPIQTSSKSYEWVDVTDPLSSAHKVNRSTYLDDSSMELANKYFKAAVSTCNTQLNLPNVKEWLQRKDLQFDMVVLERLPYQCFHGIVHRVGSPPLVGIVTLAPMVPTSYAIGNPMNPAYIPEVFVGYTDHMNFWQRLENTIHVLRFLYFWQTTVLPTQEAIMREHFGPEPPSVFETDRNYSLMLTAVHFSGYYPRPNLANVIELTGLHVDNATKPLPKDLKQFIEEAEHGVIYFSLGSIVTSETMPPHRIQAFVDAFRELPQRVIWKFGGDSLPDLPNNVITRKWMPQKDILAHPNVKLFIMQGGLQSLNEAAYRAIPVIAIPFFSDQRHNAAKIVSAGIGATLNVHDLTKETVIEIIRRVLQDPSYRESMNHYSELFREHQAHSVSTAVWWLEYVIRHKGAPHLRSAALDLHWWQLLLLDVIAFILLVVVAVATAGYFAARMLVNLLCGKTEKLKKQ